jgi:hypothetical protein
MPDKKPHITISLSGTEGNAFAIIAKAHTALKDAGLQEEGNHMVDEFRRLTHNPTSTYERVKQIASKYCQVTWLK